MDRPAHNIVAVNAYGLCAAAFFVRKRLFCLFRRIGHKGGKVFFAYQALPVFFDGNAVVDFLRKRIAD